MAKQFIATGTKHNNPPPDLFILSFRKTLKCELNWKTESVWLWFNHVSTKQNIRDLLGFGPTSVSKYNFLVFVASDLVFEKYILKLSIMGVVVEALAKPYGFTDSAGGEKPCLTQNSLSFGSQYGLSSVRPFDLERI